MDRLIIIFYDTHSCVFKLKRYVANGNNLY